MKKVIATMAVAALAAWAAPASAGVVFSDPGKTLTSADNTLVLTYDHTNGGINLKLSFDYDGKSVEQPCELTGKGDCLTLDVNGFKWLDNADIPDRKVKFGPELLNEDGNVITMTWTGLFNRNGENVAITNIKLRNHNVPEPATIAVFGLGLAGLGFMRRKRSA